MLFVIWLIATVVYIALLITGMVVKRYRVEIAIAEIPVALFCALLQYLDGSPWIAGVWVFIAAMAAVSLWFARKTRELSR